MGTPDLHNDLQDALEEERTSVYSQIEYKFHVSEKYLRRKRIIREFGSVFFIGVALVSLIGFSNSQLFTEEVYWPVKWSSTYTWHLDRGGTLLLGLILLWVILGVGWNRMIKRMFNKFDLKILPRTESAFFCAQTISIELKNYAETGHPSSLSKAKKFYEKLEIHSLTGEYDFDRGHGKYEVDILNGIRDGFPWLSLTDEIHTHIDAFIRFAEQTYSLLKKKREIEQLQRLFTSLSLFYVYRIKHAGDEDYERTSSMLLKHFAEHVANIGLKEETNETRQKWTKRFFAGIHKRFMEQTWFRALISGGLASLLILLGIQALDVPWTGNVKMITISCVVLAIIQSIHRSNRK